MAKASFSDFLSGKVKLFDRPQIVVQERVKIADFPPSLETVKNKLLTGKTLTLKDKADLLAFQQEVTGEFKPIGFVGEEAEITLGKGEVLIKGGTQATTVIEGRRVPIISTTIKAVDELTPADKIIRFGDTNLKPSNKISALSEGLITPEEYAGQITSSSSSIISVGVDTFRPVTSSASTLSAFNAFSGGLSSSPSPNFQSLGFIPSSSSASSSGIKKTVIYSSTATPSSEIISPVIPSSRGRSRRSRSPSSPSPSPSPFPSPFPSPSPSPYPKPSPSFIPSSTSRGTTRRPPITYYTPTPIIYPQSQRRKQSRGYDVFVRKRGQFKKITTKGLSYRDALDFGAYRVTSTARATFFTTPSSTSGGTISKRAKGSFGFTFGNLYKKGNLFIEKKEKRIKRSSAGEKAEITAKGIAASKNKRRLKIL